MKRLFTALSLVFFGAASPAFAGDGPKRVVELFTSQGCSSSPKANEQVTRFAEDPDTLVLTYGVSYWDYLGWEDSFAEPAFAARQKAYGKTFEMQNVYTPQMVINGAVHGSRFSESDIQPLLLKTGSGELRLVRTQSGVNIDIPSPDTHDYTLVQYVPGPQSVTVKAGENKGRVLTLTNVVTDIVPISDGLSMTFRHHDGRSYALLAQNPKTGRITHAVTTD